MSPPFFLSFLLHLFPPPSSLFSSPHLSSLILLLLSAAELKASHGTAGYGVISKSCKGLRLDYYIPPFDMLDDTPKQSILSPPSLFYTPFTLLLSPFCSLNLLLFIFVTEYGVSLSLEEGGLLVTLPSTVHIFPSSPPADNDQAKY